ncbi:hypothetical protein AB0K48_44405 [Nonomuraea sp. NPDC055795]
MGIGQGVRVWTDNVVIYQCPETFCNRGAAHRGQDIALICKETSTSNWLLVLNRGWNNDYNAVGWVDRYWLSGIHYEPPICFGQGNSTRHGINTIVYQCPEKFCNPSSRWPSQHDIAALCNLRGSALLINHNNNEVGFLHRLGIIGVQDC